MPRERFQIMLSRVRLWWSTRNRTLLPIIFAETAPLDLRFAGRMVFHAALVGVAAGFAGALFFGGLEYVQRFLLEDLAGYRILRAHGETFAARESARTFRPWLLVVLPALGGLVCGLLTRFAPEARGGGGDAMIDAFHHHGGVIRRRVIWVKALASLFTLGTGGAGGREGPTMQIGGALGSVVAQRDSGSAPASDCILLVAGVAAGISAVFRTPLGAALLAVEVLYRDGYEAEALIPAVLASVIAYSVVISIYGESTLFAHAPRFPFVPGHLPLYALLAVLVAALSVGFVSALRRSKQIFHSLPIPDWARPAVGGLALGAMCTPIIIFVGAKVGTEGQGLGLFGGGYGAVPDRHQRREVAARRVELGGAAASAVHRQALRGVRHDRLRGQRGRLRSVPGDRRLVRRRVRTCPADPPGRPAHRSRSFRLGGDGRLLRRHRSRATGRPRPRLRARGELRPPRSAHARPGHRLRGAAASRALLVPGRDSTRSHPSIAMPC